MKRIGFFILLLSCFAMSGYTDSHEFYKEFRYRIEPAGKQSLNNKKAPPVKLEKASLVILESREVNSNKGLGHGGWKKVSATSVYQASERHIERIFINSPKAWVENGFHVSLKLTADNRWYWWESDGTLHFYTFYKELNPIENGS
jgi:hypothetical protein